MIAVVIATYNRPKGLRRCLEALARQSRANFEVVVVDDCSSPPVSTWLTGCEYPFSVRVLSTSRNSGPARARNLGVASTSAEFIAFIDDDVVPDPDLIRRLQMAQLSAGPGSVVIGPLLAPQDWRPTPWNRWEAETLAVEYRRMAAGEYAPTWRQFFTGNAFLEKADFVAAGGFNEQFLRAEDIELAYRLELAGCHFVFEPAARGWHYSERSLSSWRKIPRQYAWSDAELARLYPDLGWSDLRQNEKADRNPVTRSLDATLAKLSARKVGAAACVHAARLAAMVRLNRICSPLLSMAFEFEYWHASAELSSERRFNSASTHLD